MVLQNSEENFQKEIFKQCRNVKLDEDFKIQFGNIDKNTFKVDRVQERGPAGQRVFRERYGERERLKHLKKFGLK